MTRLPLLPYDSNNTNSTNQESSPHPKKSLTTAHRHCRMNLPLVDCFLRSIHRACITTTTTSLKKVSLSAQRDPIPDSMDPPWILLPSRRLLPHASSPSPQSLVPSLQTPKTQMLTQSHSTGLNTPNNEADSRHCHHRPPAVPTPLHHHLPMESRRLRSGQHRTMSSLVRLLIPRKRSLLLPSRCPIPPLLLPALLV